MTTITLADSVSASAQQVRAYVYANAAALPEARREKLEASASALSPVTTCVEGMEALYAMIEEEDAAAVPDLDAARAAMASAANQVAVAGFYNRIDRAASILAVARYDAGETAIAPARPAVDARYAIAAASG